jgi:hypothetical protein
MKSSKENMALVDRYLLGHASSMEVAQLEKLMLADSQLRSDFLAYARVDAALPGAVAGNDTLLDFQPDPTDQGNPRWMLIPAAAAIVSIGLFVFFQQSKVPDGENVIPAVAKFGTLQDCHWVNSKLQVQAHDALYPGARIELSSGSAELIFTTGAKLMMLGPAILEIKSATEGFLTMVEVQIVAETPESKGFILETPVSIFVDIGTAFTATVSPDGLSRLNVTEDEVDVILDQKQSPQRVKAGETIYVEPGARQITTRFEAGDETPAFRFPTISPPSALDYADQAKGIATMTTSHSGAPSTKSGLAKVLLDGKGQSQQDAPKESAFFKNGTNGLFLVDLGKPVSIKQINSYSWHQHGKIKEHRERARQQFTLYGFGGDAHPDPSAPSVQAGWTRIARVNTDQFFNVNQRLDRPAQQASSITSASGEVGRFRYLLWQVKGSPFFGELDVFTNP